MKLTEQRLREIITEELMNENFFKKLFGMKAKGGEAAMKRLDYLWKQLEKDGFLFDGSIRTGAPDPNHRRSPRLFKRDFEQWLENYSYAKSMAAAEAALKASYDKKEKGYLSQSINRLKNIID